MFWCHLYYLLFVNPFCLLKSAEKIEIQNKRVCCPIRILVRIILMFVFLTFSFYAFCHVMWYYCYLSYFLKTCIKIKREISNKTILKYSHEFPTTDLLRVTLVSVKGSWGVRISLNTMRSTQVFNEVLYKNSYFYQ